MSMHGEDHPMADSASSCARSEQAGWIFVHLEGTPYERGFAHGRLLAAEIDDAVKTAKFLAQWDTGEPFQTFVDAAMRLFAERIDKEYLDEIGGIAEGARSAGVDLSFEELLAWNGYMDLLQSWWPSHLAALHPQAGVKLWKGRRGHHCSAFIATGSYTRGARVVMAHNSWDRYAAGDAFNVIFDIQPTRGHRMLMQGLPGCISSLTDFWQTSAGLMITETTISSFAGFDEQGAPEFFRARKASQYADSIDDWCALFAQDNNGGYVNSWLLGDARDGKIARFELGLRHRGFEHTRDGFYCGFNTATDLKIRNQECVGEAEDYNDVRRNGARRVRWMQLAESLRGTIDADTAKTMIADHYDVYLGQGDNPCSRTLCGHLELDDARFGSHDDQAPYTPWGANDGKVCDSDMTRELSLWARWGHACGMPFDAAAFLREHPQWHWLEGHMRDRPAQPWVVFRAADSTYDRIGAAMSPP